MTDEWSDPRFDARLGRTFRALADEHLDARPVDANALFARTLAKSASFDGSPNLRVVAGGRSRARAQRHRFAPAHVLGGALVGSCALAAAALLLVWTGVLSSPFDAAETTASSPLTYEVRGAVARSMGTDGELLATELSPAELRFSDSSVIEVAPATTLRIQTLSGSQSGDSRSWDKVRARLAQGRLTIDVEHHEHTDYRFFAGPYEVRVVGTAFDLGYEPAGERLDLEMKEGRVEVRDANGAVHVVEGTHRLSLPKTPAFAVHDDPPASEGDPALGSTAAVEAARATSTPARSAPSYGALAREGRFAEIVKDAERAGIERTLGSRSAADLQELAQAARYTGDGALASRTWKTLSERFANQPAGHNAKFFLARVDEDAGRSAQALRGYASYLQTGGTYSKEALGRQLMLTKGTLGAAQARPLAQQYLERFPNGPYAKAARSLLQGE